MRNEEERTRFRARRSTARFLNHRTFYADHQTGIFISTREHEDGKKYVTLFPFEVHGKHSVTLSYEKLQKLLQILDTELDLIENLQNRELNKIDPIKR